MCHNGSTCDPFVKMCISASFSISSPLDGIPLNMGRMPGKAIETADFAFPVFDYIHSIAGDAYSFKEFIFCIYFFQFSQTNPSIGFDCGRESAKQSM